MRVVVWDLPTRVFHWLLAGLFAGLVVTGKIGGEAMVWHALLGYAVATLLLFRVTWGFVGGHWSRFASFALSPGRALTYLRRGVAPAVGHNPLGALSVYAMLTFLAFQVTSGLASDTKEEFAGPLVTLISNDAVHLFTWYHKQVGEPALIGLVTLHIVVVLAYALRGRDLVWPMVTGIQDVLEPTEASRDDNVSRLIALVLVGVSALAVWGLVRLGS